MLQSDRSCRIRRCCRTRSRVEFCTFFRMALHHPFFIHKSSAHFLLKCEEYFQVDLVVVRWQPHGLTRMIPAPMVECEAQAVQKTEGFCSCSASTRSVNFLVNLDPGVET